MEILTSDEAKPLKPSQRKCRLEHEAQPLIASPIYSYNLCRSQCRFRIALKGMFDGRESERERDGSKELSTYANV